MMPKIRVAFILTGLTYLAVLVVKQYLAHSYYPIQLSSLWENMEKGKTDDEQINSLKQAVKLAPGNAGYYYQLAKLYLNKAKQLPFRQDIAEKTGWLTQATENAEKAISLNPAASQSYITLAWAYALKKPAGLNQAAIKNLKKAIVLNPTGAAANYNLAYYYLNNWMILSSSDKEATLSMLKRTLSLNPEYSEPVFDRLWRSFRDYEILQKVIPPPPNLISGWQPTLKRQAAIRKVSKPMKALLSWNRITPGTMRRWLHYTTGTKNSNRRLPNGGRQPGWHPKIPGTRPGRARRIKH